MENTVHLSRPNYASPKAEQPLASRTRNANGSDLCTLACTLSCYWMTHIDKLGERESETLKKVLLLFFFGEEISLQPSGNPVPSTEVSFLKVFTLDRGVISPLSIIQSNQADSTGEIVWWKDHSSVIYIYIPKVLYSPPKADLKLLTVFHHDVMRLSVAVVTTNGQPQTLEYPDK